MELMRFVESLAARVARRGGDLATSLALMGADPEKYEAELEAIANIHALTYYTDQGLPCPEGGRIFTLTVSVDHSRTFKEALIATSRANLHYRGERPSDDWVFEEVVREEIKRHLPLFPAEVGATVKDTRVILVKFGKTDLSEMNSWARKGSERVAVPWAKEHHLLPASPHTLLAVGERYPKLSEMTGCNMQILTPVPYDDGSNLLGVFFSGGEPMVYPKWIYNASPTFDEDDWFAFVREE